MLRAIVQPLAIVSFPSYLDCPDEGNSPAILNQLGYPQAYRQVR